MNMIFMSLAGASETLTLSEKLSQILSTAVTGYLLVFAVMALIWGILEIFGKVFGGKKRGDEKPEPTVIKKEETAPEAADDEREVVAAIMAAISAYTDKPQSSFRVVSFKKVGNNNKNN